MASIIFKWLRRCLFICVCAFFLMSHNASALVSQDVVFYGSATATFDVHYTGGTLSCSSGCNYIQNTHADTNSNINTLYLSLPAGTFQSDTVFRYDLNIFKVNPTQSLHTAFNSLQVASVSNSIFSIYDIEYQQLDTNSTMVSIYLKLTKNNISFSSSSQVVLNSSTPYPYNYILTLNPSERVSGVMRYHFSIVNSSASTDAIVNAINSQTDYSSNLNQINNNINNLNNSINNINNDVENSTQDAADEAADSGDQSAADAENATAGLISVIGGFVNAITSASPSNCKINGKINNSFNMGELDLCSMPVPPFVQIISSLILIAICIPFAIIMFNRFIGLFRSFQS